MFAGMGRCDAMVHAVRDLRAGGLTTALVSNSWSTDHYDRDLLAELFDAVVISGEVRLHKPSPRSTRARPSGGDVPRRTPACSSTTCARTARAPRRSG